MTWDVALRLGRVSNLPTVWTNVLAGTALAGGSFTDVRLLLLLPAMSLFYLGGMYLNDAFDADVDALERPERPIPSGQASVSTVMTAGFAMLLTGLLTLVWVGYAIPGGTGFWPVLTGLALGGTIIFYNWHHKNNPLSPLVMGLCRMLVYVTTGLSFAVPLPSAVVVGALLLLSYLIGLTYVAKQESLGEVRDLWPLFFLALPVLFGVIFGAGEPLSLFILAGFAGWVVVCVRFVARGKPGDIPRAVVSLIAGISLLDAMLVATAGAPVAALVAVAGFALTLAFQRLIPGT